MTSIQQELESFSRFAQEKLRAGASAASIDELYDQWREEHGSREDELAIAASLRDMEAGETGRDFDSFAEDFRRRNGLAELQ